MMKPNLLNFSRVASFYEEVRPSYPKELYDAILNNKKDSTYNNNLEIGAGPGNSTFEILKHFEAFLTVIEPNDSFYQIINDKFSNHKRLDIIKKKFEESNFNDNCFDIIFAATTFQWLDPMMKYEIASRILKSDGVLALYWNNYLVDNRKIKTKLEDIFDVYDSFIEMVKGTPESIGEKILRRKHEISDSSLFEVVEHSLFERIFHYTSDQFCKLIRTFADQPIKADTAGFMESIKSEIFQLGDKIDVKVITNLEIAKKM